VEVAVGKKTVARTAWEILVVLLGSFTCAFGLVAFTIPHKIASGGLTGVATILYYVLGTSPGFVILLGNAVLIVLQSRLVGMQSAWKTILSVAGTSVFIEVLMRTGDVGSMTTNPIIACLYGGILGGIGVGMTFRVGGTTGGADIISQILNHRFHIPVGDTILVINCLVTVGAGFAFGPELALYGLLLVFFSGRVIDAVLEGIPLNRSVLIISNQGDVIAWAIIEELRRGVTCLDGRGAYSGKPTSVLLVALRRRDLPILRKLVWDIDPNAFMIVGDARQVIGKGFINLGEEVRVTEDA
jgi:uncharacterized membrane-anchored protein YitT (DUF2179 family)